MVRWTISDASSSSRDSDSIRSLEWQWEGEDFTTAPDCAGFVYVIHNIATQEYYIGQKQFWTVKKLPPLKGRKNKRHKRVESDWRDYWGSSKSLQQDIEQTGKNQYVRTVLALCNTKGECNYLEAKLQFEYDVLHDPLSYNGIINCKIHRSHVNRG